MTAMTATTTQVYQHSIRATPEQVWDAITNPETIASRVTWEIEPARAGTCKLTLVHDKLEGAPKTAASVRGWSFTLSNLKTVLETGEPFPAEQ